MGAPLICRQQQHQHTLNLYIYLISPFLNFSNAQVPLSSLLFFKFNTNLFWVCDEWWRPILLRFSQTYSSMLNNSLFANKDVCVWWSNRYKHNSNRQCQCQWMSAHFFTGTYLFWVRLASQAYPISFEAIFAAEVCGIRSCGAKVCFQHLLRLPANLLTIPLPQSANLYFGATEYYMGTLGIWPIRRRYYRGYLV